MAFTDVETAQAHDVVNTDPTGEDLCKLGLLYSTGQGGTVDYVEAHKWFNLATLMGCDAAKYYRQEISDQMDTMQISRLLSVRLATGWPLATRLISLIVDRIRNGE